MTHRLKSVPNNKKDRPSRRSPVPSTSASGPSFEQAIDLLINDDQVPAHLKTIVRHVVEKLSGMELLIKKNSELENRLKEEMAEQKRLKSEIESLKRALSSNKDRPGKRSPLPPTSAREPSLDQAIHLLAKDDQIPPHLKAIVKHLAEKLSSMELLTKKNFELEDRLKEETAENKRLKDEVESLKQAMSGSEKYSSDVTSETHKTPRNPRRFKKSTLDNRPEWNNGYEDVDETGHYRRHGIEINRAKTKAEQEEQNQAWLDSLRGEFQDRRTPASQESG